MTGDGTLKGFATPEQIKERYLRPTIAHPQGTICHDGDCYFYGYHVCTCGLLHQLAPLTNINELYPNYARERGLQEHVIQVLLSVAELHHALSAPNPSDTIVKERREELDRVFNASSGG